MAARVAMGSRTGWLLLSLGLCLAAAGCECPEYTAPSEPHALEINPHPPGWPGNMLCCDETGHSEFEFATTYSWANVVLNWSSYKKLGVGVTLARCQPRDAGDCVLARVVDNETTPDGYGAYKGEYNVSGQGIRLRVSVTNPEPTSVPFALQSQREYRQRNEPRRPVQRALAAPTRGW